jgi:hypothetical protein
VTGAQAYTANASLSHPATGAGYAVTGFDATSQAGAIAANNFVQWGLDFNQAFDLTDFIVRFARSSTPAPFGGPVNLIIQMSVNGGAFSTVLTDTTVATAGENSPVVDLSAFDNVTSVDFRYYGWNGVVNSGSFQFQNGTGINTPAASFKLQGTLSVVPEPAVAGLLGLMALGLLRRRHA